MTEAELTQSHYEALAHQIEREDGLVNTRIGWMLTFQGFLFTSMALLNHDAGGSSNELYQVLRYLIPALGVVVALLAMLSVHAAQDALKHLKKQWNAERFAGYPRPFGAKGPHTFGALNSYGLPVVTALAWVVVALYFVSWHGCGK